MEVFMGRQKHNIKAAKMEKDRIETRLKEAEDSSVLSGRKRCM